MRSAQVSRLVSDFLSEGDQAADKSVELGLQLLAHTAAPFSREQFAPGHITCTGLVLHPERDAILLVHHHRLKRWLLPGGHVEPEDVEIWDTARREVMEETGAALLASAPATLVGIDVHGIPPNSKEPFHLHHDLIFGLRAVSAEIVKTEEAHQVAWCTAGDWETYDLPMSIRLSARRALR